MGAKRWRFPCCQCACAARGQCASTRSSSSSSSSRERAWGGGRSCSVRACGQAMSLVKPPSRRAHLHASPRQWLLDPLLPASASEPGATQSGLSKPLFFSCAINAQSRGVRQAWKQNRQSSQALGQADCPGTGTGRPLLEGAGQRRALLHFLSLPAASAVAGALAAAAASAAAAAAASASAAAVAAAACDARPHGQPLQHQRAAERGR